MSSNLKQNLPEVSIELIKEVVKKYKSQGFDSLIHHDLAVALSTIGFTQVCKQFGASWTTKQEQRALAILQNSDYDLGWFGRPNILRYTNILTLCRRGDIEKVKDQIRGMNKQAMSDIIKTVDNFKRNCLHLVVLEGFDILTEFLINQGFSVNARDRQLKTPLHYCKNELICQVLLKNKAKVLVRDNKSCTPVHYAAARPDFKSLELMLQNANVVNQIDSNGKTALFYAIYNSSEEQINIIRIILQNGGKINHKDMFGKTPLHYASEMGKSRCIPILLQKGASVDIRDKHGKTPIDLASNEKIKKVINVYCQTKGVVFDSQQNSKRKEFSDIKQNSSITAGKRSKLSETHQEHVNEQIYTKDINQVSTWIREKFFVLMKKLQESGVKALWHVKRPYIYTGSWAEDTDGLEDLYQIFLNVNGPQAAMRTFNILCPYEKQLPTVMGKSEEAFQSFFGENWFSTDPIQKVRNMHSTSKVRSQLEVKVKQNQDLRTQLLTYKSEIDSLEAKIMNYNDQINQYKKIQDELRKQRSKNTQQYSQILKLMSQNEQLKTEIETLVGGEEQTKILSTMVEELRSKNEDYTVQISRLKDVQAAARRKCGQIFLKTISMAQNAEFSVPNEENMYDDDSVINLYNLLKNNPPNLQKRFQSADRRGVNKLNIDEFTKMMEQLSMLPQDVMSMHRITGFAFGRKFLSLEQFKTILENRHKNRPMWEKKLIRKVKAIILQNGLTLDKFFTVLDKDGNGTIQATELRKGLQNHNIFMNQNDWSNLFNLLDSDRSGQIDLEELKLLMEQQRTGKVQQLQSSKQIIQASHSEQSQKNSEKQVEEQQKQNNQQVEKEESEKEQVESEQFSQPYQQKDSEEQGFDRLNGKLKMQLRFLKLDNFPNIEKVYAKFFISEDIDSDDSIKMVDLSKQKKLNIATELNFMEYKVQQGESLRLNVSIWMTREFDEQNYLGEVFIDLKAAFIKPNDWGIADKFKLEAEEFEKQVSGLLYLQVRWAPEQL